MEQLFGILNDFFRDQFLPIIDPLYILVVLVGASLLLRVFEKYAIVKHNKFQIVFFFATIASFFYVGLDAILGRLDDAKAMLFRNFINYGLSILLYHTIIKTLIKVWDFLLIKFGLKK